jgi:pimeloyl-ACP methyl ester carboxylesterase
LLRTIQIGSRPERGLARPVVHVGGLDKPLAAGEPTEYGLTVAPRLLLGSMLAALAFVSASPAVGAARSNGPLVCKGRVCRGYVVVPLDYSGKVSGRVQLFVAEILPEGKSRGTVFELAGGPGQSSSYAFGADSYRPWDDYTKIVYDNRGTGQSSRIACGPFIGIDPMADTARCSAQLGPERAFYSTRDSAADMESIRQALGVDKVAIWGTSYGTKQALAYAQQYPQHVERLLLDSTLLVNGPDPYNAEYARSVPAGITALCAGKACARASADPAGDVVAVANTLAATPLKGAARIVSAGATPFELDGYDVLALAVSTDLSDRIASALPSAVRAAREGRPQELERLWALESVGSDEGPDQNDYFSEPIFVATMCDDGVFPWLSSTPLAARPALLDQAVAALPATMFAPLGPWVANFGFAHRCLGWESTGLSPLAEAPYPNVPVLIVSGDRDIRTPTANARAVAALFPQAKVLVVHGAGHSVLGRSDCAAEAAGRWLDGLATATECKPEEKPFVLPTIPASVGSATPLKPGGRIGRTLAAVVATLDEVQLYVGLSRNLSADGSSPRLVGLVAGSTRFDELRGYSDVPGVVLDGHIALFGDSGTVTVRGSAAAHGRLEISTDDSESSNCTVSGTLGGRYVSASC